MTILVDGLQNSTPIILQEQVMQVPKQRDHHRHLARYPTPRPRDQPEPLLTPLWCCAGEPGIDELHDLPYAEAVIREVIRLDSPAAFASREAKHDIILGGKLFVLIPPAASVCWTGRATDACAPTVHCTPGSAGRQTMID